MLPSRGLRPAQFAPLASRQSNQIYSGTARKFSSLNRTAGLAHSPRTSLLSARRTTAGANPHIALGASSVRYGSWYAPWSWGRSSTPGAPTETVPIAEFSNTPTPPAPAPVAESTPAPAFEPEVTTATPEIAPAGIDKAAVTENTVTPAENASSSLDAQTMDELLGQTPVKDVVPKAELDPTQLIDHPGQLAELGLDYGYGITTMFEKLLETIYLQSGWGWAGTIVASTVIVRSGMFVFQALSSDKMAAMAALKPVTGPLQEKLNAAIAAGDKQKADLLRMQQAAVMKPHMGGMAWMGGFTLIQAVVGFSAFRCLRAMGELPVPGMTTDGFLWFTDLAARDPYFILPATTTAIMYKIFKSGGETGVADATAEAASRRKIMTGMAFFIGIITAFQASALQLYFLTSGVLGAGTGYLLKQNAFRRMIGIRALPSPESNELFSKVAKGELKLKDIKGPDGKIRYQPPTPPKSALGTTRRNATLAGGAIKIKEGTSLPLHLRPAEPKIDKEFPDRDADFDEGPKGSISERMDYYRRNYKMAYVKRRVGDGMRGMLQKAGYDVGTNQSREEEKRKRKAEQYEVERRRRFENRR
ncbi:Mitochondrial inner membrane protein oxa1 [Curvularia kusanoi]|uniref:Mitochondrial inner membrane protein oxa1 n=1 Tax=Curvularia kusanoi TaxID=90978 RepID=A0A9P4TKW3_CURKU|nr:Mitochondrial inner membrane protein oxa1 [Curvularia kusanoi]